MDSLGHLVHLLRTDTTRDTANLPRHCKCTKALKFNLQVLPHNSNTMPIVPPIAPTPGSNEVVSEETLNFDYPGMDIILRSSLCSCDSLIFRGPELYVINSSPGLRELTRSISNTSDVLNGEEPEPLPVVKLPESMATLHSLLTFISPVTSILPSTAEKIMKLLALAQKYQMDTALNRIRDAIARQDPPFICPETALHVYFLAQEHELHQEALDGVHGLVQGNKRIFSLFSVMAR